MKRLMLVIVVMFAALPAFSDSINLSTFALQNVGFVSVPLGPGLDPLLNATTPPRYLSFITYFDPVGAVVFSSTLSLAGQQFTLQPLSFTCASPNAIRCGVGYGWEVPLSYKAINGTLTINLNGLTENYAFKVTAVIGSVGDKSRLHSLTRNLLSRKKWADRYPDLVTINHNSHLSNNCPLSLPQGSKTDFQRHPCRSVSFSYQSA
jgi:hypothetical protein